MPPPRYPSRIEPVSVPIFAMDWIAVPDSDHHEPHHSIIAYCGGGGSAKTGIGNAIFIDGLDDGRLTIKTGDEIGVAMKLYHNPMTKSLWLLVCLKNCVQRYRLPDGEPAGSIDVGEEVSAVAIHSMADHIAIGCEGGKVMVFKVSDEHFDDSENVFEDDRHQKAVCCMDFSVRGGRLVTSAKDGTACVYQGSQLVSVFQCSVQDDKEPPPKRAGQVIVKGCAFLELDGRAVVTVASPRRGKAFIARWWQGPEEKTFSNIDRAVCSNYPISSFRLSEDARMIVLGSSDGSVILWDANGDKWKAMKTFNEVHDFPVTCVSARPFLIDMQGEEDGIRVDARSASADGKMACLTTQRRGPRKASSGQGINFMAALNRIMFALILAWLLNPLWREFQDKCGHMRGFGFQRQCFMEEVLLAPPSRPGISVPPY